MTKHCGVEQCSNNDKRNSDIAFHKFPKSPLLKKEWYHRLKIGPQKSKKNLLVCGDHFKKTDYDTTFGKIHQESCSFYVVYCCDNGTIFEFLSR